MKRISKNLQIIVLAVMLTGAVSACDGGRSTTIVTKTDNLSLRIKYAGKVVFTEAQDGIEHISDGGYLEFEKNGRGFKARQGANKVNYEFDGDDKIEVLDPRQKQFVAEAVKLIIKERANKN